MTNPVPPPAEPPAQPPVPPPPGPPQAKGGKRRQVTILVVLVVFLGVLLGLAWFFNRDAALNAKVGDCLHQTGPDELKIVKCDSADADYVVLGKVADKEQVEATVSVSSVCDQWQDTTARYWQGEQGKKGDVLCLKAAK